MLACCYGLPTPLRPTSHPTPGEELRAAVEEWQLKRGSPGGGGQRLTTAFLDGTHPVVDVYELKAGCQYSFSLCLSPYSAALGLLAANMSGCSSPFPPWPPCHGMPKLAATRPPCAALPNLTPLQVRLEHMLQRLRVLQQASLTGRPVRLMPRLYLSGAVEASSLHLLRHLGITHVLNATEVGGFAPRLCCDSRGCWWPPRRSSWFSCVRRSAASPAARLTVPPEAVSYSAMRRSSHMLPCP